jgi:tRNA-binding EMAP/Myf-like protein
MQGVVVGYVIKVRPHPGGERIWLADVDIGRDYLLQIVWGGVHVVEEGSLVPVAPPGAWLPDSRIDGDRYKMRRRRYRGETSEGMLCSLAELGWDPTVTDRVALLSESIGLQPGDSLDNRDADWPYIVKPVIDPSMRDDFLIVSGTSSLA